MEISATNRQIARAAGTVMLAFVVSNLVGLLRQVLAAQVFGTQAEMDAFNAANRVSETLFNLVAGGALASAFIPTFTGLLAQEERDRAWKMASAVTNLVLLVASVASILCAIFAPQIVRSVLAPGLADQPALEEMTVALMRLMLPSAIIFALSGLVMGMLNSHQVFLVPALTPAMYQVGLIIGLLGLAPRVGIYGLAWGAVLGSALHLILQIPALLRLRGRYWLGFGLSIPEVHEVFRLMGPRLLGVAVVQLNFWVNTRLASRMPEGSVTGVVLAFTLMLMPQAALAQSIAIAAMPTFSAQVALGKLAEMRHALSASLRGVLLLSAPAALGLIVLRQPIISLLYQRGEFTARSTELVAWALLWYAVGLVGHSLVEILSRAFYALHDTKTPVLVGVVAMSLNVIFSLVFAPAFARLGWMEHGGLALANSLATILEALVLLYLMRHRLDGLEGRSILRGGLQALVAAGVMGLILLLWMKTAVNWQVWLVAGGGILVGVLAYGLAAWLLGVRELRTVLSRLLRLFLPGTARLTG